MVFFLESVNQDKVMIINTPREFIKEPSRLKQDERYRKMIIEEEKETFNSFLLKKPIQKILLLKKYF